MGARDMSIIRTPPSNRYPIVTELHRFDESVIKEAILYEMSRGGQIFFIHNRVETIREMQHLLHCLVPGVKSCVGHGQMQGDELERIMHDFIRGDYDVLIATTIIESGLDIPNANTIIINQAQNYGLSDLHQLRGRVGRSNRKAFCYLLAPPLDILSTDARRRLKAIEDFSGLGSGFNIAMQDLDIRGAGNILGGEQSGFITEIGYETYQRILNEALLELREEKIKEGETPPDLPSSFFAVDCVIDTDFEMLIPDTYVESIAERVRLYRELDNLDGEDAILRFEIALRDRFGDIPPSVKGLMEVVRVRARGQELGIERLVAKNGKMTIFFISDQRSPYYASPVFRAMLQFVQSQKIPCSMSERNGRLNLTFTGIDAMEKVSNIIRRMHDEIIGTAQ
jgi:transcription-repair coupling factor (superfamily II helicase)